MTDSVYVNADRTAVVDQFGPGKKWHISREEAIRLGLLASDSKPQERRVPAEPEAPKPKQRRRTAKRK